MVLRQTIAAVRVQVKSGTKYSFTGMWTVLTAVLIGIVLGAKTTKNIPQ